MAWVKRAFTEMAEIEESEFLSTRFKANFVRSDSNEIRVRIFGMSDTPYSGAVFDVRVYLPSDYPFSAPKIRFLDKIWHPSVSYQGEFCTVEWLPGYRLAEVFMWISLLLQYPDDSHVMDPYSARQYITDRIGFDITARLWAKKYAGARDYIDRDTCVRRILDGTARRSGHPFTDFDESYMKKVDAIKEIICVDDEKAEDNSLLALSRMDWNVDRAMEYYLQIPFKEIP